MGQFHRSRGAARPDSTVSERELTLALAAQGRSVTLATLAAWRKDGLLPPLACHGLGAGKGKTYYWREDNIVAHACAAFDCLRDYGRPDMAITMLWLSGFTVPLPQLRRAWANRNRTRQPWKACHTASYPSDTVSLPDIFESETGDITAALLMRTALMLSDGIVPHQDHDDAETVRLLDKALVKITRDNRTGPDNAMAERLWHLVQLLASVLEGTSLIADTGDDDMRDAQHFLGLAARLLQSCSDRPCAIQNDWWSRALAERFGPPLFLVILVLLRSGRRSVLERLAADMEGRGRRIPVAPAPAHHWYA